MSGRSSATPVCPRTIRIRPSSSTRSLNTEFPHPNSSDDLFKNAPRPAWLSLVHAAGMEADRELTQSRRRSSPPRNLPTVDLLSINDICRILKVSRSTSYRYLSMDRP
jgi:hypothetical protein